MDEIVLKCNKCSRFYVSGEAKDIGCVDKFKGCGGIMLDTGMKFDEYLIISKISQDRTFLNAMINLKEKDPIEFQLKMSQFKTQVQQQESNRVQMDIRPKCPTCGSTDLSKVSTMSKAGSVIMFGLLSQKVKKTWHCNKCKYEW